MGKEKKGKVKPSVDEFKALTQVSTNVDWKGFVESLFEKGEPVCPEEVAGQLGCTTERASMRLNKYVRKGDLVKRVDKYGVRWYLHKDLA